MNPIAKIKEAFRSIDGQLKDLRGSAAEAERRIRELSDSGKQDRETIESLKKLLQEEKTVSEQALQRAAQVEEALAHQKQLAWHMQYFYDSMWARTEWERTEALCPGNRARIEALRNCHKGERCFIIGNGPSLRAEDLDKLKNEITFACNRINLIFDQTDWRPTYYCITDLALFHSREIQEEASDFADIKKLFCSQTLTQNTKFENTNYFVMNRMYRETPEFSSDASNWLYEGGTITYISMQLAAYMGFSEIYLLGVDNTFKTKTLENGNVVFDWGGMHFSDHYVMDDVAQTMENWMNLNDRLKSGVYDTNTTYRSALWHSKQLGIKIFNATRGGALEVFPRVGFDELMKEARL